MSTDANFALAQLPVLGDGRARAVRESARVAGYAAGWAEGSRAAAQAAREASARTTARADSDRARARTDIDAAVDALTRAAQAAQARTVPVLEDVHSTLLARALELAEAVVGVEMSDGARSARAAITRALDIPADVELVRVRLNPADLAAVQEGIAGLGEVCLPDDVALLADATLDPGDARSEFSGGFLDGHLGTAFARARAALEAASQGATTSPAAADGFTGSVL